MTDRDHFAPPNHDAAPAATAGTPGTCDTQSFDAYAMFAGSVMNWISEATGFLHDDVLRTDDARDLIHNACRRCWNAFDRIASPTIHGAAPEAIAESDEDRTDKAATSHRRDGTGDTPATHATRGEGSEQRECTEPVAWAVANGSRVLATSISRMDAVDMQGDYAYHTEIVPLYREPTLTDEESDDLRMWFAECMDQSTAATDGANEELSARWLLRAHRAAVMLDRLGGWR